VAAPPLIRGYKNTDLETVHHLCRADSGLSFVLAKGSETGQGENFYHYIKNKQEYLFYARVFLVSSGGIATGYGMDSQGIWTLLHVLYPNNFYAIFI
jgi:hypothetical protein